MPKKDSSGKGSGPSGKITAADLIARSGVQRIAIPKDLRDEIEKLIRFNAGRHAAGRVSRDNAIAMCKSFGLDIGPGRFDRMIRDEFGCDWGGSK